MAKAKGSFQITSFNEETLEEGGGDAKVTHASGEQSFSGDVTGGGSVNWLMSYRSDGTARYVGLQRIEGAIGGRRGSFVIEAAGDFDGAASKGTWTVIVGAGTGELRTLRGSGTFEAPGGPQATYELDYDVD